MFHRPLRAAHFFAPPANDTPAAASPRYRAPCEYSASPVSRGTAARRPPPAAPLTGRQLECLEWISEGKSSTDIGAILGISPRTVDYHVAEICRRLGVRTRMQAVKQAVKLGWLRS